MLQCEGGGLGGGGSGGSEGVHGGQPATEAAPVASRRLLGRVGPVRLQGAQLRQVCKNDTRHPGIIPTTQYTSL